MTTWPRAKPQHGINPQVLICLQYACSQLQPGHSVHFKATRSGMFIAAWGKEREWKQSVLSPDNSFAFFMQTKCDASVPQAVNATGLSCVAHIGENWLYPEVRWHWISLSEKNRWPFFSLLNGSHSESSLLNGAFDSTTKSHSLLDKCCAPLIQALTLD